MEGSRGVTVAELQVEIVGWIYMDLVSVCIHFIFNFFVVCDRVSDTKYNDRICIVGRSL